MRPHHIAWIVCLTALAAFVALNAAAPRRNADTGNAPAAVVSVAGTPLGGTFTLMDHDGNTVTDKTWPDKYLILYFGFTHCPDICPVGLTRIADALKKIPPALRAKIQPLLITVDPARDTPETLKNYVGLFDAGIIGLTGTDEQLAHVRQLYRVYAQKAGDGDDYMVNHSGFTYVMTPDGTLADVFPHEATPDEIAASLRKNVH